MSYRYNIGCMLLGCVISQEYPVDIYITVVLPVAVCFPFIFEISYNYLFCVFCLPLAYCFPYSALPVTRNLFCF